MGAIAQADRIGHFVADSSIFLSDPTAQSSGQRWVLNLLWFKEQTANTQWARMVRREFVAGWWVYYLVKLNRLMPGAEAHKLPDTNGSRDIGGLSSRSPKRFRFTGNEEETAKAWLRRRGWTDACPFVCLLVRDSAYLSRDPLHSAGRWDYHGYRDSDIESYVEAVQELIGRGVWVIRMGKQARVRFPWTHPMLIDYPFEAGQEDLLDIWLSAHCRFFISTLTGLDNVAMAFRRPLACVNFCPLGQIPSFAHGVSVPKKLRWAETGRRLTLREQFEHHYLRTADYQNAGILIEDLSASEITEAVCEVDDRLAGRWEETPEDVERQKRFWNVLRGWPASGGYHDFIHPQARAGDAWLKANESLLFG